MHTSVTKTEYGFLFTFCFTGFFGKAYSGLSDNG